MTKALALLIAIAGHGVAHADLTVSSNAVILGQVGVGTLVPRARLDAKLSMSDDYGLKVSSPNGNGMLTVDKAGKLAIGVASPVAGVDVNGSGDDSDIGLQVRVGNSSSTTSSSQIVFAYSSTHTYRHSIRTRAVEGQDLYNTMDFFLFRGTGTSTSLGDTHVLSLQSTTTASGSVHVMPAGTPHVELEVSSEGVTGGGSIHRLNFATHSSRKLKSEIIYLKDQDFQRAYQEVKGLKHAIFRYKSEDVRASLKRGLIYEDVPASLRGSGKSVILDERVLNLEMALIEVNRRIKETEALIASEEHRRRRR